MTRWGDILSRNCLREQGRSRPKAYHVDIELLPLLVQYHTPKLRSSFVFYRSKIRSKQEISFAPEGNKKGAFEEAMNYGEQCQNIF
jgi:hypothetical protein